MNALEKRNNVVGTVCIILATLCWGLSGCSGQYLLHDLSLPTPVVLCIRQVSAGLILIVLDKLFRQKGKDTQPRPSIWKSKQDCKTLLFFSLFGICLTQFSFFMAIYYADSGTATVLQYLSTIIILIVTCIQQRIFPKREELLAILAAVAGTFVISTGGRFNQLALLDRMELIEISSYTHCFSGLFVHWLIPPIPSFQGRSCGHTGQNISWAGEC